MWFCLEYRIRNLFLVYCHTFKNISTQNMIYVFGAVFCIPRMLYKVIRIPMIIVKPHKLYMFYGIYYVLISILIFTFEVCREIPCVKVFCFLGTMQQILGASQLIIIFVVWWLIELSCYKIFLKGSCITKLLVSYLDAG